MLYREHQIGGIIRHCGGRGIADDDESQLFIYYYHSHIIICCTVFLIIVKIINSIFNIC